MPKKIIVCIFACGLLVSAVGCERIHEPWVRGPDQLKQERARPYKAELELRHRFIRVQTDR